MTRVTFGLRVPTFPIDGSGQNEFLDQILRFLGQLKDCFDSAWVDDHFVPWAGFVPRTAPTLESFTTISYLSGVFQRLTFGNIVLCNSYRNPAVLAKMAATLQMLTGGRFILGIGAGWKEDEYVAYGYEFPPPKVRIGQLDEAVQIIRKMWIEGTATFEGRHYKVHEAHCFPKPNPVPPIMIGGGGEKLTLRLVARHADWWNLPNVSAKTFQCKLRVLREHCDKESRDAGEIVKSLANIVAIAKTEDEAFKMASNSGFVQKGNEENYVIGDVDEVTEKLAEYTKLGVAHFILRFLDFPKAEGAKLFAEKVIPRFKT